MAITISYKGQVFPVTAEFPHDRNAHWWVEYTVTVGGRGSARGATPKTLRRTLPEAIHYARWLQSRGLPEIREDIAIYPVDQALRRAN